MSNSSVTTISHEEQLERLRAENDSLRKQLQQAQRLAAVGTMTAMVAHEFNNILTPIISYAQLAQSNPAMTAKAITRAADGGQRASHICKAILGLSRANHTLIENVNIVDLVNETLSAMAREPRKDGIELSLNAPANLTIKTHRVELQQVLLNLIINARTAVMAKPAPRTIEIIVEDKGRNVEIHVADNGVGIPQENLQRIFEPFFTTKEKTESESGGNGLGLAICKDIVAAMKGDITVRSTPGQGTTFTILLPAA